MPLRQTGTRRALSRSARTRWAAGDSNCAWAKKKQEHPKILENFSKVCQLGFHLLLKFIRQNNWSTKNSLSRGKASVFPQLYTEAEEYPKDLLGPSGRGGMCT
jgi:hypothetical protein